MPNTVSKKHHVMLKKSINEYLFFQKNKELVAIMDWYSRKVLSWKLSNSLDSDFCVAALEEALEKYGNLKYLILIRGVSLPTMSLHRLSRMLA